MRASNKCCKGWETMHFCKVFVYVKKQNRVGYSVKFNVCHVLIYHTHYALGVLSFNRLRSLFVYLPPTEE